MKREARTEWIERLRPYVSRAKDFSGWHFDDISPKRLGPPPPWKYELRASELLMGSTSVLDLGTGGGETFGELCGAYRGRAFATEEWEVNAPVAAERLRRLGIEVVRCRSIALPFRNGSFGLVLNRHEDLNPGEVGRVLVPGGRFLTEQVGRNHWRELREFFPRMRDFGPLFEQYQSGLRLEGLVVSRAETHDAQVAYRELEEVVFMLCVTPWTIPRFDPLGGDLDSLIDINRELWTDDGIVLTDSLYLIEAQKPG